MSEVSTNAFTQLLESIENKTARIGVVGLGYVGLPLIDAFVNVGFETIGFDVDNAKVSASGASTAKVNVNQDLEAESSGVSNVIYRGTADVHIDTSGSGTVRED